MHNVHTTCTVLTPPAQYTHSKSFLSLFTRKALSTYVELQDGIIRNHIAQWLQQPGEREVRNDVRYVIGGCLVCMSWCRFVSFDVSGYD